MIQRAKIKLGNMLYDAVLDAHIMAMDAVAYDLQAEIKRMQSQTISINFTPGYEEPNTVEGSISEPITDEKRLLK